MLKCGIEGEIFYKCYKLFFGRKTSKVNTIFGEILIMVKNVDNRTAISKNTAYFWFDSPFGASG